MLKIINLAFKFGLVLLIFIYGSLAYDAIYQATRNQAASIFAFIASGAICVLIYITIVTIALLCYKAIKST